MPDIYYVIKNLIIPITLRILITVIQSQCHVILAQIIFTMNELNNAYTSRFINGLNLYVFALCIHKKTV